MILKLAKLAFEQLKQENIVFCEKDLKACGIDVSKDAEFTGMIAEIFKKEVGLYKTKIFCFVHLSVQEFLAAVHVQNLLKGLITHPEDTTESIRNLSAHIKELQQQDISDEASVNLFYCLLELKDNSLYEEIQSYLSSNEHPGRDLSSSMCTVLTYILLMSEKVLDEFNPKRFTSEQSDYKRLIPAGVFFTLDPNTADTRLILSEENRKVKWVSQSQSYPDHPDRFDGVYQLLPRSLSTALNRKNLAEKKKVKADYVLHATFTLDQSVLKIKLFRSIMNETQTSGDEEYSPACSSVHQKRSEAEPSCVSMKSDWSMDPPMKFKSEDSQPGLGSVHQRRSEAESSCVSMKRETSVIQSLDFKRGVLDTLRSNLLKKFECLCEGAATQRNPTLLNEIYTELYITESERGEINNEHEVRQIETQSRREATEDTAIKCSDIFRPLPGQDKDIRTVLTKESLALEKQSLCRSSSWTGPKGKRIRTPSSYFHFLSEKST
ncbi:uncharacterized protein LOC122342385 [Puntigrus tetrazona]|uniref:uncharacterized protein LOC122342385 n=1 Tax=Puntigrus tetrazona TaxID=1606681 RepID=UPI001C8908F1|nr:uncharacterized protein LOC122342385 [Puntigrus tetrazona]